MQVPETINYEAGDGKRTEKISAWQDPNKML